MTDFMKVETVKIIDQMGMNAKLKGNNSLGILVKKVKPNESFDDIFNQEVRKLDEKEREEENHV